MKDKKAVKFDLQKIKLNVLKSHKDFVDGKRDIGIKVEEDKGLVKTRVLAKIRAILTVFRDCSIIDNYAEQNPANALGVDSSVVCFVLAKKGHSHYVYIMTDGKTIVVKDSSFMIDFGNSSPYFAQFFVEDVDSFDWDIFSNKLLDHIHVCVYNRREVNQINIFGI